jgi:ATP-dependent DNA helicase RecG
MAAADPRREPLETSIQYVKGVGPRLAERFAARGVRTVGDALYLLPRRYEDRRRLVPVAELRPGEVASFEAQVLDFGSRRIGRRRRLFELLLGDRSGQIRCLWFNFNEAAFRKRFQRGDRVRVAGKVEQYRSARQLVHPDLQPLGRGTDGDDEEAADGAGGFAALVPVYPEIEGIYPRTLRQIIKRVVERYAEAAPEVLPEPLRRRHGMIPIAQALRQVHFPPQRADPEALERFRSPAHRRLVFEELFLLQLGLALRRRLARRARAPGFGPPADLVAEARRLFGFALTGAQQRVLGEILADLTAEQPMNRLLQGDVGAGKTAVAVLAALAVARAGGQTALMAPTEILAEQHLRAIRGLFAGPGAELEVELLTAAVKGQARKRAVRRIAAGSAGLVVGTQALIEERVAFHNLGLAIIDEQHRFGVMQRARLRAKGRQPHVLVMTATPIPRTLSLTVYGDLDTSILDELPPGRTPVATRLLRSAQAAQAYRWVRREVEAGGRAYLVYPLVAESDKVDLLDASRMFERLAAGPLAGLRLGLVHGRLPPDEKDARMRAFAAGELDVLVATTVIEVGVDVPEASVMVIEHAERFGLSQLHQLRGRVGRGERPAQCFLVAHSLATPEARRRLQVMERSNDGFAIAEEDLAIRGPGEFLGTRQSGLPIFAVADLLRDADILDEARRAAFRLLEADPELARPEHAGLRRALKRRWGGQLALAEVG